MIRLCIFKVWDLFDTTSFLNALYLYSSTFKFVYLYCKWWGIFLKFSIKISSLISKVESRKLAGALDSCFVLFGTLQQCTSTEPGGSRTHDLTVRKPVSNHCATSARSQLELSTSPINDILRELSSIASYVILTYRGMVGLKYYNFPFDDQITVDFMHQMSWLVKYFVSHFVGEFQSQPFLCI